MKMLGTSFLLHVFLTLLIVVSTQSANFSVTNCLGDYPSKSSALIGWPWKLSCFSYLTSKFRSTNQLVTCIILNNEDGSVVFNATGYSEWCRKNDSRFALYWDKIKANQIYNFQLVLMWHNAKQKCSKTIIYQPRSIKNRTCDDFAYDLKWKPTSHIGEHKSYSCGIKDHLPGMILTENHEITWKRNCSDLPTSNLSVNADELQIRKVDFQQAGIYTCSVTFNGATAYLAKNPVCVNHPPLWNQETLACSKADLYLVPGENLTVSCQLRLGKGDYDYDFGNYYVYWQNAFGKRVYCIPSEFMYGMENEEKMSCVLEFPARRCYMYVPSMEEQKAQTVVGEITLHLRHITSSDFGVYNVTASSNMVTSADVTLTINVRENFNPNLLMYIGVVAGIFFFLFAMVVIIVKQKLFIRLLWKRHFQAYDKDDKKYGAYIDYHYSIDIDMFAGEEIKHFVNLTRKELVGLGFRVYDDHKDGDQGIRAMRLEENMALCHRIVIILNSQYVKDDWNTHNFQKAFQQMIHSKIRLIFILLPGMKPYIKQQAAKSNSNTSGNCLVFQEAIRLNYVIQCEDSRKLDLKVFRQKLEDAMPKLPSKKGSEKSLKGKTPCDKSPDGLIEISVAN
ncbi:unnamed protein product [Clavelina lepadiformis]|uniref:Soluble interferon alpha/beta receptor OPG204 n=1 Tax=Clavelina lepadiformis TaxID=159417 RepID=A0ABP0FXI5_CLALP